MALRCTQRLSSFWSKIFVRSVSIGELGKGAGKSGGSGGTIRDAGGAFGKMEAGREEEYFHRKQKEQLALLRKELEKEVEHHEQQKKTHEDAMARHKRRIAEIEDEERRIAD